MADTKISALTDAGTLTGAELLLLSQSGADRKLALSALGSYAGGWVRPSDWPVLPATASNQIDILAAISDDNSNYVALSATVTGGFTVDWGDGTAPQNYSSGATAEYFYSYAAGGLGAVTARGYKTAKIKITSTTGSNNITAFDLGLKHSRSGLGAYSNPWLDIQVNAPSATAMIFQNLIVPRFVERIVIVAIGAITSLGSTFANHSSLRSVSFPAGSLTAVTTLSSTFSGCTSLKDVSFPSGSLSLVTTLANMFNGCSALREATFPSGSLSAVTTLASTFQTCSSLQRATFPSGALTAVTTLSSTFNGCTSLQSVSFPSGSLGSVATTTNAFNGCTNLSRIANCGIPVSFSVASAKLGGAQLDEIYTALPSAAATITVSTNHGTVDDTPSIATGKGWTVTGS